MTHGQLSTKCQLVIPKEIRMQMGLKPGHRVTIIPEGLVVHLVGEQSLASLKGIAKGVNLLEGYRDKSDRP